MPSANADLLSDPTLIEKVYIFLYGGLRYHESHHPRNNRRSALSPRTKTSNGVMQTLRCKPWIKICPIRLDMLRDAGRMEGRNREPHRQPLIAPSHCLWLVGVRVDEATSAWQVIGRRGCRN